MDKGLATLELTKEQLNHLGKCLASYEAMVKPTGDLKILHSKIEDILFEAEEQFDDNGE